MAYAAGLVVHRRAGVTPISLTISRQAWSSERRIRRAKSSVYRLARSTWREREAHLDVVSGTSVFPCFFIYGEVCSFQQCVRSLHIFDICQASCIGEFRLALPPRLKVWEHEIPARVLGSRPGGKKLWHRGRAQTNGRTLEA
jgi:hypothetical protein